MNHNTAPWRPGILLICISYTLGGMLSCSSDDPPTADAGPKAADSRQGNEASTQEQGQAATLPPLPTLSGVAYIAHYHSEELRWYRIDRAKPEVGGELDLGKVVHDLTLDPYNDHLYVVGDNDQEVDIYQLSRPAAVDQPVADPQRLTTISLATFPLFARVNPHKHRLYVLATPSTEPTVDSYKLHIFDVTDPKQPEEVKGSPHDVPLSSSLDLDPAREVLFMVEAKTYLLHGFDLRGDQVQPLGGAKPELLKLYPQENQLAFQARSLTADPYRNRLYAARPQANYSELIVLEYPAALPTASAGYGDLAQISDVKKLQGPFDVDTPVEDRPNIIDAFMPAVDLERGHIFLSAGAYGEIANPAIAVAVSKDLELAPGCKDHEEFGCFYQSYYDGTPVLKAFTDGATCVDWVHRVMVGTTVTAGNETAPGTVIFFKYEEDLSMSPLLPEGGGDLAAGALPVGAVCH